MCEGWPEQEPLLELTVLSELKEKVVRQKSRVCVVPLPDEEKKGSLDVVDDRSVRVQLETPLHYSLLTSFFWNTCFVVVASLSC